MFSFNYLGIFLCAVFSLVLGFLWYNLLFAKSWRELLGMATVIPKTSDLIRSSVIGFISALLIASVFYIFVEATFLFKGPSFESGLFLASLLWLGFIVPFQLNRVAWEMRSWKLLALNAGYEGLRLAGIAAILWFSRPA